VRVGDLNLVVEERSIKAQLVRIKKVLTHPNYNKEMYYDDIALLKLERDLE